MKTILVCGGRHYRDWEHVKAVLGAYLDNGHRVAIIAGDATGADAMACQWAHQNHAPLAVYHAYWNTHGKAAGPMRNKRMLEEGKPDLVIAFPGGAGTADMVRRARASGVEVIEA
jgi:hypothetical protein